MTNSTIRGSYGVDAPYVPIISGIVALGCLVLAVVSSGGMVVWWVAWAILFALQAGIYLRTTLHGKFVVWDKLIQAQDLRGNEVSLDVGCGRGMVLIMTALHVPNGTSTGIDLWRNRDQSGNDPSTTMTNAELNGVGDRVVLDTGDMSDLPYPDSTFDLVTANVAIQNVKDRKLRQRTIEQMMRVTKPGGSILIVDVQYVTQYRDDLIKAGADNVQVRRLGLDGMFGNPFFASRLVCATKPSD